MTLNEIVMTGFDKAARADILELGGEKYFSTYLAAKRLGISCGSWYRYRNRFQLVGKQVGRKKYYTEAELMKVLTAKGE